ncbi:MAG: anaerobic ribonucleoside-triphosphate reductase activating protein [Deltaproteobacteria bacterium]|nr:anaerobic ribonucleoside-triphosphate reductase activating protein [Deltaproteobacteria bacterium]
MKIGDIQRFSLIDYPGRICAIIFTQGCNFRCPYCHNPELVEPSLYGKGVTKRDAMAFLERRRGKLDAVSITGGEPLLQRGLVAFIEQVRALGYLVKIDTNGSRPDVLNRLITEDLLDYIAMDVKAPLEKYREVVKASIKPESIAQSIQLIMNSGIDYEFKTTVVNSLLTKQDLEKIGTLVKGAKRYFLQRFVPSKTLDPAFMNEKPWADDELSAVKERLEKVLPSVDIR